MENFIIYDEDIILLDNHYLIKLSELIMLNEKIIWQIQFTRSLTIKGNGFKAKDTSSCR